MCVLNILVFNFVSLDSLAPRMTPTGEWMMRSVRRAVMPSADQEWQTLQLPYGRASTPMLAPAAAAKVMAMINSNPMPFDGEYPMYYPEDFGFLQAYELMQGRLKFGWLLGKASRPAHAPQVKRQCEFRILYI